VIHIFLNGERRSVESQDLQALLGELRLGGKRVAIELNLEIVPRSAYPATRLREGDRVEIVQAIGGG
jgi:sulfur carrier protein